MDGKRPGVAFPDICLDLALRDLRVGEAFGEAGIGQDRPFDLGDVEPTAVFRGVMEFRFPGNGARLFGRVGGIKGSGMVGIQVVEHDTDRLGFGIQTDDMTHAVGKFDSCPAFHDQYLAPTALGFADHHPIAYPVPRVFGILPRGVSGLCRNRLTNLADESFRTFVETHPSLASAFVYMFALVLAANLLADAVRGAFDPGMG